MELLENTLSSILSMGLSDLLVLFVCLYLLKLEIKLVLKIVGAVICFEVFCMILSGLPLDELAGFLLFGR